MKTLTSTNSTAGLLDNMIFDGISQSTESVWPYRDLPVLRDFEVPARIFHVECGLVTNVSQNGTSDGYVWNITTNIPGQNPDDPLLLGAANSPIRWLGKSFAYATIS